MMWVVVIALASALFFTLFLLWKKNKEQDHLRQKILDLTKLNKENAAKKTKFLATASHDLQQPHQALGLLLASINIQDLNLETATIINKAKDAHATTSRLLNQLLDISRLDTAEKPELKRIALHELVHSIGMKFMPIASSYGVELRIRVRDAYVMTDPVMLERMLTNILLNAFRHAKKANVLIAIRKKIIAGSKHWRVEVYDTGIGIPHDKQQLIFQEFTKLSKPELTPTGLGLGLAIVKRLSNLLDHPVGLRSQLGKGSCFYIQLKASPKSQHIATEPTIDSVIRQRMKVAVINENMMLRDSLETLLASWGCQAKAFKSSMAALNHIKTESWLPDALIVDGTLETTQLHLEDIQDIRNLSRQDMPMILITKETETTFAKEAEIFGFTLLSSPINANDLRDILGERKS
jgi:nitrogen-specific signal transduction histidine kinase/CheY-like chemotaxis protein